MAVRTIIIGAGPAGLAVGACLRRQGELFEIFEREESVGSSWRRHYDRLRLHTDRDSSSLPYFPVPRHYPLYPTAAQYAGYLEAYTRANRLRPRLGEGVDLVRHRGGRWRVETKKDRYEADRLVVATGYHREPYTPSWPGLDGFSGSVIHSSAYMNGASYRGQRVLIIGFGNSGAEIALDLHEHGAAPVACVRGEVGILPREFWGVPIYRLLNPVSRLAPRLAGIAAGMMMQATLNAPRNDGRRRAAERLFRRARREIHTPIVDMGTLELIQKGEITLRPAVRRFVGDGAVFVDGSRERFDAVILATGYRPRLRGLFEDALTVGESKGLPVVADDSTVLDSVYFCGFRPAPEGMLRAIGRDARAIARKISRERMRRARPIAAAGQRSPAAHSR